MTIVQQGNAICYSGYRKGESPVTKKYPSYEKVVEDLTILSSHWEYIRMYDASPHTETTLRAIKQEGFPLKVLLGMDLLGEISNVNCPWGGEYTPQEIARNIAYNQHQLRQVIELANAYPDIVLGVSAGNEAVPEWNENLVAPERVLYFVNELKQHVNCPVTYCDNNYYWHNALQPVAEAVDFISIHVYPVWLRKDVDEAIAMSINDYNAIQQRYPNKQVIITEAGWPTLSNGHTIPKEVANQLNQLRYIKQMSKWSQKNDVLIFFFEAFDEPWKGSNDVQEPEKNWGFYYESRYPKTFMKQQ